MIKDLRVHYDDKGSNMRKLLLLAVMSVCLLIGGCVDGETDGQVHLDPNTAEQIENVAEGAVSVLTALSPMFPYLLPFAAGGGGLLAMYRRLKPKLTAVQRDKNNLVWGGELLAEAIDGIKDEFPETWAKVGPGIHRALKSSLALENAIREFRHLAPKE